MLTMLVTDLMWLTQAQLVELTRRKRPSAQAKALIEAGIPFRIVSGRPIVVESDLSTERKQVKRL